MGTPRKRKEKTYKQAIDEILYDLPWSQRQQVLQAGEKYRKPADLAEVERLYYRALGLSEAEINRRMEVGKRTNHVLKVWPEFFEMLHQGKNFEIRKNDRDYQVGDRLTLKEWKPAVLSGGEFTGKQVEANVISVVRLNKVPGLDRPKTGYNEEEHSGCPMPEYVVLGLNVLMPEGDQEETLSPTQKMVQTISNLMRITLTEHQDMGSAEDVPRRMTRLQMTSNLREQVHKFDQALMDLESGKETGPAQIALIGKKAADVAVYATFLLFWAYDRSPREENLETDFIKNRFEQTK